MDRSLDRAVGRLWLFGFPGAEVPDEFLRLLGRYRPQTIILFRDNLPGGAVSLGPLRRRLEEAAEGPLALFLDEEGGWIQQLDTAQWPSPRAQALSGEESVEACHRTMAAEAAALGADALCAPLADLDDGAVSPVIGTRSFGPDPDEAGRMTAAAVRGLLAGGALPVLKHFPGHGDAREDSHFTLPAVDADRNRAMAPFRAGVAAGARAIMSAHLRIAGDEDRRPATFRRDLLKGWLEGELGFGGLVISDALEMAGAAVLPAGDRATAALAAGCHLLTLARWEPGAELLPASLGEALRRGELPAKLRDEAEERLRSFLDSKPIPADDGLPPRPDFAAIRRRALFVPGSSAGAPAPEATLASAWDGSTLDCEFGPCGSWRAEEFEAALAGLPLRRLRPGDDLAADSYLHVGRSAPSEERQGQLRALARRGRAPSLLICGCWGWSLPFPARLASADSTPAGLRAFLGALGGAHAR